MPDDKEGETSGQAPHRSRAWLRRCTMTLMIVMAFYVAIVWFSARTQMRSAMDSYSFTTLIPVLFLVLLGILLRIIRWQYFIRQLKWRLPFGPSAVAFMASLAFTATPGKVGEAVKVVFLRERYDIGVAAGVGVLIVERLGDLIAVLALSTVGIALLSSARTYLMLVAVGIAAIAVFLGTGIYNSLLARISQVERLRSAAARVLEALDASRALLRPTPFLIGIALAIVAWSLEAAAFAQLAHVAGLRLDLLHASSTYGMATLGGVLSTLPGGIGGFEAIMAVLLNHSGVALATAMPVIVVFRLCTLWFGILLGIIAMLAWTAFYRPRPSVKEVQACRGLL